MKYIISWENGVIISDKFSFIKKKGANVFLVNGTEYIPPYKSKRSWDETVRIVTDTVIEITKRIVCSKLQDIDNAVIRIELDKIILRDDIPVYINRADKETSTYK